jgi:hypothetical protein
METGQDVNEPAQNIWADGPHGLDLNDRWVIRARTESPAGSTGPNDH